MNKKDWSVPKLIEIASKYNSVLDIGCGSGNLIRRVDAKIRMGVDAYDGFKKDWDNKTAKSKGLRFLCQNIGTIYDETSRWRGKFECVYGLDIIEHLEKWEAVKFLGVADLIAIKCLMWFIPVGNHPQEATENLYMKHKSEWYPEDMEKLGYNVDYYPNWHNQEGKDKGAMWCWKEK